MITQRVEYVKCLLVLLYLLHFNKYQIICNKQLPASKQFYLFKKLNCFCHSMLFIWRVSVCVYACRHASLIIYYKKSIDMCIWWRVCSYSSVVPISGMDFPMNNLSSLSVFFSVSILFIFISFQVSRSNNNF